MFTHSHSFISKWLQSCGKVFAPWEGAGLSVLGPKLLWPSASLHDCAVKQLRATERAEHTGVRTHTSLRQEKDKINKLISWWSFLYLLGFPAVFLILSHITKMKPCPSGCFWPMFYILFNLLFHQENLTENKHFFCKTILAKAGHAEVTGHSL